MFTEDYRMIEPFHKRAEMEDLFHFLTDEFINDCTFGDQTYLNVYIKRNSNSLNKRDFYNSLRGFDMPNEDNWEDYAQEWEYEYGTLYKFHLGPDNARTGNYTHKNIYAFVPHQLNDAYWDDIDLPGKRQNMWFSYMEHDCTMEWHTDGDTGYRYHHVIMNDSKAASICCESGDIHARAGEAFILNTNRPHMVPYCEKRLHVICSLDGEHSTGVGHNNQWIQDQDKTWADWQDDNGY